MQLLDFKSQNLYLPISTGRESLCHIFWVCRPGSVQEYTHATHMPFNYPRPIKKMSWNILEHDILRKRGIFSAWKFHHKKRVQNAGRLPRSVCGSCELPSPAEVSARSRGEFTAGAVFGGSVGGSINGDIPIAGWFVRENPVKWMRTRGTPILGNHHAYVLKLNMFFHLWWGLQWLLDKP